MRDSPEYEGGSTINSVIPLAVLRVLAVVLFMLGISSMHSPDLAHSAPSAGPTVSMAMTDAPHTDPPLQDEGGSSPHQRWVGACLAVLGTLGAVLALCCPIRRSTPMDRARRPRSTPLHRATRAWSPPEPSIHRLCVMRV